ncbi:Tripartite tricarboxylate transporter family receptor [compost metagenome]
MVTWYGLFGPADLPRDIVEKINGAVNKVLQAPDMQRTLLEQGMVTQVGSAADFDKMYRDDYVTLGQQIKTLGMTAE